MTVSHKFIYSRYQPFQSPTRVGIMTLERCSRVHGTEFGAYE